MNKIETLAKIHTIADHYGLEHQIGKAAEELGELLSELLKYRERKDDESMQRVIGEIADVEVMLTQIKYLLGISQERIDAVMLEKVDRQIGKIKAKEGKT